MAPSSELKIGAVAIAIASLLACQSEYEVHDGPVDVDPGDVTDCEFSPVSGTKFSSYDCNPVFSSTGESWASDVYGMGFHTTHVLGHPFYQMWYTATPTDGTPYAIGYAVSGDGENWEPHEANPLMQSVAGQWDQDSMDGLQMVWDHDVGQYVMLYQGITLPTNDFDPGRWGLGVATSPDGVSWSKHPANPVLDFNEMAGDGFTAHVSPCWPLGLTKGPNGFTGYIAASYRDPWAGIDGPCELYGASASSLDNWNMGGSPIMTTTHSYEAAGIADAAFVELDGTMYMFYIGFETWEEHSGYRSAKHLQLSLATSSDGGTSWTKDPSNPILEVSNTSEGLVSGVGAQVVGSRIHLWITDHYEDENGSAVGYFYYEPDVSAHP